MIAREAHNQLQKASTSLFLPTEWDARGSLLLRVIDFGGTSASESPFKGEELWCPPGQGPDGPT